MFEGIINRAQHSIDALASKYLVRVAVAIPLVIALGFCTAAAAVLLSSEFGSATAYLIIGGVYAAIGLATAAAVAVRSSSETIVDEPATQEQSEKTRMESQPMVDPEAILAALGAVGPMAFPMVLRLLSRNLPLVLAVVILAFLLFSQSQNQESNRRQA